MTDKKEKTKIIEEKYMPCYLTLVTTNGKEILIKFENDIEGLILETVLEELRECIINNQIYSSDIVDINFQGTIINELDCQKVIGIKWE